jgi:hypothetical protein
MDFAGGGINKKGASLKMRLCLERVHLGFSAFGCFAAGKFGQAQNLGG